MTSSSIEQSSEAENACKRDKSIKMIIVMIIAFILLKLPKRVNFRSYYTSESTIIFKYLNDASRSMSISNSAVNFLIYFASGKQFRHNFWRAFPCLSIRGKRRMESDAVRQQQQQQPTEISGKR